MKTSMVPLHILYYLLKHDDYVYLSVMQEEEGTDSLFPLHRLDTDVSGVLIFSK